MVAQLLIVLDGAPEPPGGSRPTTLQRTATPALDALCAAGVVTRRQTTPDGFEPGTETGFPTLLGVPPAAPVARGPIEAAAAGIAVPPGASAWRIDLRCHDGSRAGERERDRALPALARALPAHRVTGLRGHRLLAVGPGRPVLDRIDGLGVEVWPDGAQLAPALDKDTIVVCGPGAAAGCARLLGASVVVPAGATGDVDTDLAAKADAARRALAVGSEVGVHVGALDEAAHRGEPDAKAAALARVDAELIAPLAAAAQRHGASVAVTADHSTCPDTGRHGCEPVPLVVAGPGVAASGPDRLTEELPPGVVA